MLVLIRSIGWSLSSCRSAKPMHRSTPRFCAPAYLFWQLSCSRFLRAFSWLGEWWCRSARCRKAQRRSAAGILDSAYRSRQATSLRHLANQFNHMAGQLQESYATLERKVEERTNELALANLAKSRFLATASHDLRQPLHALGLFVAQLNARMKATERSQIINRINDSLASMNQLFSELLDISKLDSGVLTPNLTEFPIAHLLKRIEATFLDYAAEEGNCHCGLLQAAAGCAATSSCWNESCSTWYPMRCAIRPTGASLSGAENAAGSCASRYGTQDSGFQRISARISSANSIDLKAAHDRHDQGGLGLGLAIVDRLCRLLGQPIQVTIGPGKGSCFAVSVPLVAAHARGRRAVHCDANGVR